MSRIKLRFVNLAPQDDFGVLLRSGRESPWRALPLAGKALVRRTGSFFHKRPGRYGFFRCLTVFFVVPWIQMTSPRQDRAPMALPTAAELDILAVLWTLGVATVREVHDELGNDNRYTTTLKTIQLMTEKGLLTRSERFGSHVYEASVPKEQTQRQIAGDVLKRAFGGSARSLVMGALTAQPASREELDEIRGMLDSLTEEKGNLS
jgi:BlaI family penicillinase repressor